MRFLVAGPARTGMLHADPHPGNFRIIPADDGSPGRLGVLDFGAVARLPEGELPLAMGTLIRIAASRTTSSCSRACAREGFVKDRVKIDARLLLDYLSPFVEPTQVERFRFSREWMQAQFQRINNPRDPSYTVAIKINLPPSYLLIHRTWLGGDRHPQPARGRGAVQRRSSPSTCRGSPSRLAQLSPDRRRPRRRAGGQAQRPQQAGATA